jgi:hypothetical protein
MDSVAKLVKDYERKLGGLEEKSSSLKERNLELVEECKAKSLKIESLQLELEKLF